MVEARNLLLSGICGRCKRHYTVFVENMPAQVFILEEGGGSQYMLSLAEHVIFLCPYCRSLVNAGNGSRRNSKRNFKN